MARVNTTASIVYIDGAEFDGIYIVDGLGIMWDGVYNSEIIRIVQESLRSGKVVAAVGHGVAALCNVTDDRGRFIVAGKQVPNAFAASFLKKCAIAKSKATVHKAANQCWVPARSVILQIQQGDNGPISNTSSAVVHGFCTA